MTPSESLYDQHSLVLDQTSADPTQQFLELAKERKAKRQKQEEDKKKLYESAWTTIEGLKAEGWYQHDNVRQTKRDDLRGTLTEYYAQYGTDAFTGPEGQQRMAEFKKKVAEYEKFETYSGQMKEEFEKGAELIQKEPDKYDPESVEKFLAWRQLPYEEQLKQGVPRLLSKEEALNWMEEADKIETQGFIHNYSSSKADASGSKIITQDGVSIREDDLRAWAEDWIRSGRNPHAGNKGGKAAFDDAMWRLTKGDLQKEGGMLDNNPENRGEDGMTDLERRAHDVAVEEAFQHQKRRIATSYAYKEEDTGGTGAGAAGGTLPSYESKKVTTSAGGSATVSNVIDVSQAGSGEKSPKSFIISPSTAYNVSKGEYEKVTESFFFFPSEVFDANVLTKPIMVNRKFYKKGDIVPDEILEKAKNQNAVKQERLVKGYRTKKEQQKYDPSAATVENTYYVPEREIKGSMQKHVKGYGGNAIEVDDSVFKTQGGSKKDDDRGV